MGRHWAHLTNFPRNSCVGPHRGPKTTEEKNRLHNWATQDSAEVSKGPHLHTSCNCVICWIQASSLEYFDPLEVWKGHAVIASSAIDFAVSTLARAKTTPLQGNYPRKLRYGVSATYCIPIENIHRARLFPLIDKEVNNQSTQANSMDQSKSENKEIPDLRNDNFTRSIRIRWNAWFYEINNAIFLYISVHFRNVSKFWHHVRVGQS